ncbi:MAG: hypothetical protein E7437_08085 [Ruminococcaceae bacterium]|nr:hypothetical protein [Oscillospiraceae bacterium]
MNNPEKSKFSYIYSAPEQAEIKRIREKYTAPTESESKLERLQRLDSSVTKTAMAVALTIGILGTLIMGSGMSLCMTELPVILNLGKPQAMAVGIAIGVLGGILAALAYPVYCAAVRRKRKKIAPEILRLTNELMK